MTQQSLADREYTIHGTEVTRQKHRERGALFFLTRLLGEEVGSRQRRYFF
jgi:hypothetical protein